MVAQLDDPFHSPVHQLESAKLSASKKSQHVKQNIVDNLHSFLFLFVDRLLLHGG
jgi:hypothetical protein